MSDERPQPEYGEYASESEQASAIERSGAPRPKPAPPSVPATASARRGSAQVPVRTTANAANRIITIFLLSFGLVYVIGGAESFLSLGASMERLFGQLGIGTYTPTSLTTVIGIVILVSQGIIWLITAGWSYVRMSRGRVSWWIPVAGGVASLLVSAALLGIVLGADPAFST